MANNLMKQSIIHEKGSPSKEHPFIVIFPNNEVVVFEDGCISITVGSPCFYKDDCDEVWKAIDATFSLAASHFGEMKIIHHGGAKVYLRYKEKERRAKLKKKGGKAHAR